jgi:hypothetical protein
MHHQKLDNNNSRSKQRGTFIGHLFTDISWILSEARNYYHTRIHLYIPKSKMASVFEFLTKFTCFQFYQLESELQHRYMHNDISRFKHDQGGTLDANELLSSGCEVMVVGLRGEQPDTACIQQDSWN